MSKTNGRAAVHADPFDPDGITDAVEHLPDRTILYAPEGWGKTSFAAQAEAPLFLMSKGEDGLKTLIRTGQLPPVPHFPKPAETWNDLLRCLDAIIVKEPAQFRTIVLDVLNGFERLCFEHVCQTNFKGDWMNFDSWARGPKACIPLWGELLTRLDSLRSHGYAVIALCHASVEKVPNPAGLDYDRYQPAMDRKYLWPATHKWADAILFGGFELYVEKSNPQDKTATRGKAHGGTSRVLHCQPTATLCAKNRHGLPAEIALSDSPEAAWADFQAAFPQPTE